MNVGLEVPPPPQLVSSNKPQKLTPALIAKIMSYNGGRNRTRKSRRRSSMSLRRRRK
jgi:hypothetical protein